MKTQKVGLNVISRGTTRRFLSLCRGVAQAWLQLLSVSPSWIKVNPKCRQSDSVPCFTVETAKAKPQDSDVTGVFEPIVFLLRQVYIDGKERQRHQRP